MIFWYHFYNSGVHCFGPIRTIHRIKKIGVRTDEGHLQSRSPNIEMETLRACEWHKFTSNILTPASSDVVSERWLVWKESKKLISQAFNQWEHRFVWTLHWRHNGHGGVSNHQPHGCLLHRLFRRISKKTSKAPRQLPLWGEFTGTGEFPAQRASNAENGSISWRHHAV